MVMKAQYFIVGEEFDGKRKINKPEEGIASSLYFTYLSYVIPHKSSIKPYFIKCR